VGVLSWLVLWPLAPARGVVALGELIQRRVDQELNDPATTRKQLEALEEARERGEISPEKEEQAQAEILQARITPTAAKKAQPKDR
jgi:cytochrome c-type biogenesis protein CcmH/NrfG